MLAEIFKKTYMKATFSFLLILLSSLVYAQKELVSTDIDKYCYKFKIENEKIVGNGSEILNNKIFLIFLFMLRYLFYYLLL